MAKLFAWFKQHLPTQRRMIQLYTALLYNAHVKGYIKGNIYTGNSKMLCVPGLNCYSCPAAIGACPLGALQNAIASSGNRTPVYVIGILLLYGLILGRTICGYLCPIGLIQELLHKIPTPKVRKNRISRVFSWLKYVLLVIFVIAIPLRYALQKYPVPAFCKYICPAGTLEGALGLLSNPINADKYSMLGLLFTRKFLILLAIIAACIFIFRAFCRFICPLGAIYGMFAKVAIIGVKVDVTKCTDCGRCVGHCKMDITHVGDHECIHCGECISACPSQAISFRAGKIILHGPELNQATPVKKNKRHFIRIIAWSIALAMLFGALAWINHSNGDAAVLPDSDQLETSDGSTPSSVMVGNGVGMKAPDFSVPRIGEDGVFTLSDYIGKKVIINFWATWCTPCCSELPYFDEISRRYGNEVVVVAVHSSLVTDDVENYLSDYNYQLPFAFDENGSVISAYGGSTMLPHTIIIDENGIITYNSVGSVTLEMLVALLGLSPAVTSLPIQPPTLDIIR